VERRAEGTVHEAEVLEGGALSFPKPADVATAAAIRRAARPGRGGFPEDAESRGASEAFGESSER
jgi:hypothetical protein